MLMKIKIGVLHFKAILKHNYNQKRKNKVFITRIVHDVK